MVDDGVHTAFEIILEEIGSVSNELKQEAKSLVDDGNFDAVSHLMSTGKSLDEFQLKVRKLQEEWINTFDPTTRGKTQFLTEDEIPASREPVKLSMSYGEASAEAEYLGRKVRILPGSTIRKESHESLGDNARRRKEEAIAKKEIVPSENPKLYEVRVPLTFGSPSGAAYFVAGCSVSGPREWKVKGEGVSLRYWLRNK